MLLTPLKQFICDVCNKTIASPEEGYVVWGLIDSNDIDLERDHKIVHCETCNEELVMCSAELNDFLDKEVGTAEILSRLDSPQGLEDQAPTAPQIYNLKEYVEFIRRLTIPYYEQAKEYWPQAVEDEYFKDTCQTKIYSPKYLKELIEHYINKNTPVA